MDDIENFKLYLKKNEKVRVKASSGSLYSGMLVNVITRVIQNSFDSYMVVPLDGKKAPILISEIHLEPCIKSVFDEDAFVDYTQFNSLDEINEFEKKLVIKSLLQNKGNLTEAAKTLKIGRATLHRKTKEYNIDIVELRKKAKS